MGRHALGCVSNGVAAPLEVVVFIALGVENNVELCLVLAVVLFLVQLDWIASTLELLELSVEINVSLVGGPVGDGRVLRVKVGQVSDCELHAAEIAKFFLVFVEFVLVSVYAGLKSRLGSVAITLNPLIPAITFWLLLLLSIVLILGFWLVLVGWNWVI